MIKHLILAGTDVYVTPFTAEEEEAGQLTAQKMAVRRLLINAFGKDAELRHHADGAPYIEGCGRWISLSHCRGYAALATGGSARIGVDIETPRATLRRVTRKYLSDEEMRFTVTDTDLLRAWTIKEALYKAAGIVGVDFARGVTLPLPGESTGKVAHQRFLVESTRAGNACLTVAVPIP